MVENKILMIAYHYPPVGLSSGVQRALKFSQYLPDLGWNPIVLSANPRAYQRTSHAQMKEVPSDIIVKRAFALDTARHLSVKGSYIGWMALPDRWISWWFGGVFSGLSLIRKHKPKVIWSTYPIATAHLIAMTLHKLTGIPWIADFRDSMTEECYPTEKRKWKLYRWIERKTVEKCTIAVFTTPGAAAMYAKRYPDFGTDKWVVIENGYDEDNFTSLEQTSLQHKKDNDLITLVHSGLLYPKERDPTCFFDAISDLLKSGEISNNSLKVILRASGHEEYFTHMLKVRGIERIVSLEPPVPYTEALQEMMNADGLLVFQAKNCNHQIPAKIYEYMRAEKPVLALTDSRGDTANALLQAGLDIIAPLDSVIEIKKCLSDFLFRIKQGSAPVATQESIAKSSRKGRTEQFSDLLDYKI